MTSTVLVNAGMAAVLVAFAALTASAPALSVAAAAGLATCAGLGRHTRLLPKLGLFLIVALVPLDYLGKLDAGTLSVTKLVFPPAFAVLVLDHVLNRRPFVTSKQGLWVLCFAGALCLSFLVTRGSGPQMFTLTSMRRYLSAFLLFVLAVNALEDERDVRVLFTTIVVTCFVSALVGLAETTLGITVLGINIRGGGVRLVGGSSENPNALATNLLVALVFALCFSFTTRRKGLRILSFGAAGVLGIAIFFSLSRAVTMVMVLTGAYMLFRLRRRIPVWRVLLVFVLLALLIAPFIPGGYYARMESLLSEHETDMSFQRRMAYNLIGVKLFLRSPVWGVGPGTFPGFYMSEEFREVTDTFGYWRFLHNLYLSIACQVGLLGLTCFGLIIGWSLRDLRFVMRSYGDEADGFLKRAAEMLDVALVAFLLSSLFLPNEYQKYMWVMFAATAAMANMRRRQLEAGPAPAQALEPALRPS